MTTSVSTPPAQVASGTSIGGPAAAGSGLAPRGGRRRRLLLRLLSLAVLYALWEITARVTRNPTFIPSPGAVWHQLIVTSTTHDGVRGYSGHLLIEHLGVSLRRILIGSVIGVAAGLVLGVVMGTVSWIRVVAEPVVTFVRALPPLAYFSLFIIWFGIDESVKIIIILVATIFPVYLNTYSGVRSVDPKLIEAARIFGLSHARIIRHVILPTAMPSILVGIRYAAGVSLLALVVSEQINARAGIGYILANANLNQRSDIIIAGIIVYAFLGIVTDIIMRKVESSLLPWKPQHAVA